MKNKCFYHWTCQLFKYINLLNECILIAYATNAFKSLETCWSGSQGCPLRCSWVCIKAFFCKHSESCSLSSVFAHFCMLNFCAAFWRIMLDILERWYLTGEKTKFFKISYYWGACRHTDVLTETVVECQMHLKSNYIWLLYWNKQTQLLNSVFLHRLGCQCINNPT